MDGATSTEKGAARSRSVSPNAPVTKVGSNRSIIGSKKPGGKKPAGLGGKKGLGGQKIQKDFSMIEKEAEMAANITLSRKVEAAAKVEDESAALVSMNLAFLEWNRKRNRKK